MSLHRGEARSSCRGLCFYAGHMQAEFAKLRQYSTVSVSFPLSAEEVSVE
ncbi:MAG: hypothetical protein NVSMB27_44800 [Ktedonobacteraceae bacterium]